MARGIKLPIKPKNGRMPLLSGDEYIDQLVATGLLGSDSENPFQRGGLGESMIFGINDSMSDAEIRRNVVLMFESLEDDQLARVDTPAKDITFRRDGADKFMQLSYRNLETQERHEIEVPIPPAGD